MLAHRKRTAGPHVPSVERANGDAVTVGALGAPEALAVGRGAMDGTVFVAAADVEGCGDSEVGALAEGDVAADALALADNADVALASETCALADCADDALTLALDDSTDDARALDDGAEGALEDVGGDATCVAVGIADD